MLPVFVTVSLACSTALNRSNNKMKIANTPEQVAAILSNYLTQSLPKLAPKLEYATLHRTNYILQLHFPITVNLNPSSVIQLHKPKQTILVR